MMMMIICMGQAIMGQIIWGQITIIMETMSIIITTTFIKIAFILVILAIATQFGFEIQTVIVAPILAAFFLDCAA